MSCKNKLLLFKHFFLISWILILIITFSLVLFRFAQAQEDCTAALERAEDYYELGEYENTITLLTECMDESGLNTGQKMRGYKLMASASIKIAEIKSAEEAINDLLDMNPNFKPDKTQDSQEFFDLVHQIKKQREDKSRLKKKSTLKWWLIGGGSLAVATTIILLSSPDSKGLAQLPEPPDPPVN